MMRTVRRMSRGLVDVTGESSGDGDGSTFERQIARLQNSGEP